MNILVTLKEKHFTEIVNDQAKAKLDSLGNVSYRPELNNETSEQDYLKAIADSYAEIIVTCWNSPLLTYKIYQHNPQLKYLCHVTGEVRPYVDLDCIKAGLIVSNWGKLIGKSVAEGALMMILSVLRRTTYFQMEMHVRKGWFGDRKPEGLLYQRIGLFGLGTIAQELAKLLKPFECKIFAYDPYISDKVFKKLDVRRLNSVEQLFQTCRIISIHAAKTSETYHVVNKNILSKFEDGGIIVNSARGTIIDTEALIAELKTGRIAAALDVFEVEPLETNSELRGLENCLLMPHLAGPTPDRWIDLGKLAVNNIENFINGREVLFRVTAEKYEVMT